MVWPCGCACPGRDFLIPSPAKELFVHALSPDRRHGSSLLRPWRKRLRLMENNQNREPGVEERLPGSADAVADRQCASSPHLRLARARDEEELDEKEEKHFDTGSGAKSDAGAGRREHASARSIPIIWSRHALVPLRTGDRCIHEGAPSPFKETGPKLTSIARPHILAIYW